MNAPPEGFIENKRIMDMQSNLALLLQGFDTWVIEAKPTCDVASRVLHALQTMASQQKSVHGSISSIPVMNREQQYGKSSAVQLTLPAFNPEKFLF